MPYNHFPRGYSKWKCKHSSPQCLLIIQTVFMWMSRGDHKWIFFFDILGLYFLFKFIQNEKWRFAYVKCVRTCTEPFFFPCMKPYSCGSILPLSACVLLNKWSLKNLEIPEFSDPNHQAGNITHPIFKAIPKFNNHQSIIVIK